VTRRFFYFRQIRPRWRFARRRNAPVFCSLAVDGLSVQTFIPLDASQS
jgi:hypothetical protein